METHYTKLPRLYVLPALGQDGPITLSGGQAHYLRNVLRRKDGDAVRLFNGRDGEWLGRLTTLGKKIAEIAIERQIAPQPGRGREIYLLFTPLKKSRLDFLIEKAVELGATHMHPVLTQNTEIRQFNDKRAGQQIIEAAEQCERLDIPACTPLQPLDRLLSDWPETRPLYACIERSDAQALADIITGGDCGIMVGPEGGFTEEEKRAITSLDFVRAASLGSTVLRAETACLKALSLV